MSRASSFGAEERDKGLSSITRWPNPVNVGRSLADFSEAFLLSRPGNVNLCKFKGSQGFAPLRSFLIGG